MNFLMKTDSMKSSAIFAVAALFLAALLLSVVGCAKKNDAPPASAGYYKGPMTKKKGNAGPVAKPDAGI